MGQGGGHSVPPSVDPDAVPSGRLSPKEPLHRHQRARQRDGTGGPPQSAHRVKSISMRHPETVAGAKARLAGGALFAAQCKKCRFHPHGRRAGRPQTQRQARQWDHLIRECLRHPDEARGNHQWRHPDIAHGADHLGMLAVLEQRIVDRYGGSPPGAAHSPIFIVGPALDHPVPSLGLDHKQLVAAADDMVDLVGCVPPGDGDIRQHRISRPGQRAVYTLLAGGAVTHVAVSAALFASAEPQGGGTYKGGQDEPDRRE